MFVNEPVTADIRKAVEIKQENLWYAEKALFSCLQIIYYTSMICPIPTTLALQSEAEACPSWARAFYFGNVLSKDVCTISYYTIGRSSNTVH